MFWDVQHVLAFHCLIETCIEETCTALSLKYPYPNFFRFSE